MRGVRVRQRQGKAGVIGARRDALVPVDLAELSESDLGETRRVSPNTVRRLGMDIAG